MPIESPKQALDRIIGADNKLLECPATWAGIRGRLEELITQERARAADAEERLRDQFLDMKQFLQQRIDKEQRLQSGAASGILPAIITGSLWFIVGITGLLWFIVGIQSLYLLRGFFGLL
jgi:hypothetical protein